MTRSWGAAEDPAEPAPVLHPSVATVLMVACSVLGGLGMLWGLRQGPDGVLRYADIAAGVLCSLALVWRSRAPIVVAAVAVVGAAFFASAGVANVFALFSVARRRRLPVALALGVLNVAAGLVLYVLYPSNTSLGITAAVNIAVSAAAVAWGALVQSHQQLLASLRERAERAEAEQRLRADQIRNAERARIAREMHDVVAHRVSLVALHAGGLQVRPDLPTEEVSSVAGLIRQCAQDALDELRGVIGILRTEDLSPLPQPRLEDIPDLVAESVHAGQPVRLTMSAAADDPPGALGRDAYRIVQEALTNAHKHAPGAPTTVTVEGAPGKGLQVTVRNELAPGGEPLRLEGAGAGLLGLTERVSLSGGTFTHGRTADGDFLVRAELRWPR
ncbi:histidine kinase [Amycolatopsis acidiphila]|uniref:histidine kinase n=1 Tax=Amycolatopsis acidiphila TaxID=715473 RepID=A0A558A6J6_9PSEU|nr:histidine kinase [Amycolatopsis acidiphila]TVT19838.1 histidine kinase [Amycolatopsis acidiphila]UIJ58744.1 histidine kinase [Amycolatopsis acidiphila]GHG71680.1 two-component sensor histidine kinase [Amycolatopsis acidiphila]